MDYCGIQVIYRSMEPRLANSHQFMEDETDVWELWLARYQEDSMALNHLRSLSALSVHVIYSVMIVPESNDVDATPLASQKLSFHPLRKSIFAT